MSAERTPLETWIATELLARMNEKCDEAGIPHFDWCWICGERSGIDYMAHVCAPSSAAPSGSAPAPASAAVERGAGESRPPRDRWPAEPIEEELFRRPLGTFDPALPVLPKGPKQ